MRACLLADCQAGLRFAARQEIWTQATKIQRLGILAWAKQANRFSIVHLGSTLAHTVKANSRRQKS